MDKPQTQSANDLFDDLLTQNESAAFLRISKPTFIKLRRSKKIPFYHEGRKLLFRKSELLQTLKSYDNE